MYMIQLQVDGKKVLLKDTSVKWESVKPVYSKEEALTDTEVTAIVGADASKFSSLTKTVPVFPYVGNAIIKCYNSNGNVARYYACATKNDADTRTGYKNVNVLDTTGSHYIISEDEATKSVGTVTD